MNDRHDAEPGSPGEPVGHDEYGRPLFPPTPAPPPTSWPYDPLGASRDHPGWDTTQDAWGGHHHRGYGPRSAAEGPEAAERYAQGHAPQGVADEPWGAWQEGGSAGSGPGTGSDGRPSDRQDPVGHQDWTEGPIPPHDPHAPHDRGGVVERADGHHLVGPGDAWGRDPWDGDPGGGRTVDGPTPQRPRTEAEERPDLRAEQFAFVEESDARSEDVIDWLKFTENRSERRGEARRRARARLLTWAAVLTLLIVAGLGYLWQTGRLPGSAPDGPGTVAATDAGSEQRHVVVVHLHDTGGGGTASALLVENATTRRGHTVLLPGSLALTADDGTATTLADSVEDAGSEATRDSLNALFGTEIEGTWRLDTPFLRTLVDLVGPIQVDVDGDLPAEGGEEAGGAPLVRAGDDRVLSGRTAVAYATHQETGEGEDARLRRFGAVLEGALDRLPTDPESGTRTVEALGQVLDPPLTEADLGAFLASLAGLAGAGDHETTLLSVGEDGGPSAEDSAAVVGGILGGAARDTTEEAAVSVSVRDATGGGEEGAAQARADLLNGGFTVVPGGTASGAESASAVVYADAGDEADAVQVARTLGLPDASVAPGEIAGTADVAVTLGLDYAPTTR
ncbi:LCP family protein [Streptomyces sp. ZYX-F-203]